MENHGYPLLLIVKVKAIRVQQILVLSSVTNLHAKEGFDTSFGDDLRKSGWMYW